MNGTRFGWTPASSFPGISLESGFFDVLPYLESDPKPVSSEAVVCPKPVWQCHASRKLISDHQLNRFRIDDPSTPDLLEFLVVRWSVLSPDPLAFLLIP